MCDKSDRKRKVPRAPKERVCLGNRVLPDCSPSKLRIRRLGVRVPPGARREAPASLPDLQFLQSFAKRVSKGHLPEGRKRVSESV